MTLMAEAGAAMLVASIALRLRSFDNLVSRLERRPAPCASADPATAYWIRRALAAWGRRLPWRAKCFEQGLAAMAMLERRGLEASLHYGAANQSRRLAAHVWVTSGEVDIVGWENKADYASLARFPER